MFLPFRTHDLTQPTKNQKNIDPTQSNPTQPVGTQPMDNSSAYTAFVVYIVSLQCAIC